MLKYFYLGFRSQRCFLACLLLFTGAFVHAQNNIFSTIPGGTGTLVGEQLTRYGQFSSLTQDVAEIHIIQIGDLASLQQNGLITITLPDSALARFSTVASIATTAIAQTKQAFLNSNLSTAQVNLVTAGIEGLPGYMENGKTFKAVLNEIDGLPFITGVNGRRAATGADLVMVMVDKNVMDPADPPIGIAYVGSAGPWAGFGVVNAFGAHGKGWPFVHEIGHNLGALHEPCAAEDAGVPGCDDTGVYEHAHTWSYKKMCGCGWFWLEKRTVRRRSVMYSVGGNNPDVIQHFSNPNVTYEGKATGIADARHNSREIANNACSVANYLSTFNPPLSVNIMGPHVVCAEYGYEFYTANVSGPPAPYTYAWQISVPNSGGTNFGPVVSTNSYLDIDFSGYSAGQYVTIKLAVTKNGVSVTSYKTVEIIGIGHAICSRSKGPDNSSQTLEEGRIVLVYPNPSVGGAVTIELLMNDESQGTVRILNQFGQEVSAVFAGQMPKNKLTLQPDLKALPNGVYFLSINTEKNK